MTEEWLALPLEVVYLLGRWAVNVSLLPRLLDMQRPQVCRYRFVGLFDPVGRLGLPSRAFLSDS